MHVDLLLLPTAPTHYKAGEIAADPIETNKRLGLYTNFVNLLDCCAVSRSCRLWMKADFPFGVTLVAPAFCDASLAIIADRLHRSGRVWARQTPKTAATQARDKATRAEGAIEHLRRRRASLRHAAQP